MGAGRKLAADDHVNGPLGPSAGGVVLSPIHASYGGTLTCVWQFVPRLLSRLVGPSGIGTPLHEVSGSPPIVPPAQPRRRLGSSWGRMLKASPVGRFLTACDQREARRTLPGRR